MGAVGATTWAVRVHGEARSAVYLLVAVKFAVDSHWTQVGEGLQKKYDRKITRSRPATLWLMVLDMWKATCDMQEIPLY